MMSEVVGSGDRRQVRVNLSWHKGRHGGDDSGVGVGTTGRRIVAATPLYLVYTAREGALGVVFRFLVYCSNVISRNGV